MSGPSISGGAAIKALEEHVAALRACTRCPKMIRPAVSGGAVVSKVLLIGQAPGAKEPVLGRPFAWTAGKTLFRWFEQSCGRDEATVRSSVYFAAACRCFPGKSPSGGDRVPSPAEIELCRAWLDAEMELLRPELVIPVGKLAIQFFLPPAPLTDTIGRTFTARWQSHSFDLIPLPHPSGASPWPRIEPGKTLLAKALRAIADHAAWQNTGA